MLNNMHLTWDIDDNDYRDTLVALNTNGKGFWTKRATEVRVTDFTLGYVSDDCQHGELCIHFNTNSWRPDIHGLIYTDPQFLQELIDYLVSIGLTNDISYSEQGMQGSNYVSFDIGANFMNTFSEKFPEKYKV